MSNIDMQTSLVSVLESIWGWLGNIFDVLNHIIILGNLSLLQWIIIFVVLDLIISSVFVLYNVHIEDDDREIRNEYYRSGTTANYEKARWYRGY